VERLRRLSVKNWAKQQQQQVHRSTAESTLLESSGFEPEVPLRSGLIKWLSSETPPLHNLFSRVHSQGTRVEVDNTNGESSPLIALSNATDHSFGLDVLSGH
jgi:hypothetical protein